MIEPRTLVEWFDTLRGDGVPPGAYVAGLGVVGGIGVGTFAIHVVHLLTRSEGLYTRAIGTLVPMCLSVVLLAMMLQAHRRRPPDVVARIGVWCFVGAVVIVTVGVVSVAYQRAKGVVMTDLLFVLTNYATVGAILGAIIGTYDGERRRQQRHLHAEHERVQQLSNRLTILNRVVRHDIRNAVNVILGHVDHIREGRGDRARSTERIDEKARELQEMSDCARRLERLLDREVTTTAPIDIAPSLRSKASTLAGDDVDVETAIPESVRVSTTPLIEEAIDELVSNAVEHNDAVSPRLRIAVRDGDGDTVTIRIGDNGPGIPEHELDVLERGHETELRHSSGLGLWFVHWVVDASNGRITFERNSPRGSVVELRLPSVTASDDDHPDESATDAAEFAARSAFDHRDGGSAVGER